MDAPAAICRCPSCTERFRITEEVLDQAVRNAGGKVRCGACLEVFDARDNLVAEAGAPQALEEPAAESWLDAPDRAEQTPTRFAAPYDQPAADEGAPEPVVVGGSTNWGAPAQEVDPIAPPRQGARLAPVSARALRVPRRGGAGKWALLTLFAAVALGAQVLAIQFPAWTQDQATRDIYALACKVIGCDLPALRAVADIDVTERSVEALTTTPDTLELRASLVNRAAFTQPLPRLELRFTNADGDVVAQHRIPPRRYSEGSARSIAPQQAAPVLVQVEHPGAEAVDYALSLL